MMESTKVTCPSCGKQLKIGKPPDQLAGRSFLMTNLLFLFLSVPIYAKESPTKSRVASPINVGQGFSLIFGSDYRLSIINKVRKLKRTRSLNGVSFYLLESSDPALIPDFLKKTFNNKIEPKGRYWKIGEVEVFILLYKVKRRRAAGAVFIDLDGISAIFATWMTKKGEDEVKGIVKTLKKRTDAVTFNQQLMAQRNAQKRNAQNNARKKRISRRIEKKEKDKKKKEGRANRISLAEAQAHALKGMMNAGKIRKVKGSWSPETTYYPSEAVSGWDYIGYALPVEYVSDAGLVMVGIYHLYVIVNKDRTSYRYIEGLSVCRPQ